MDVGDQLFHGQSRRHTHCAGQWQSSRRGPSTHDRSNEALLILSGLLWLCKLKLLERFLLALLSRGRAKKTIEASQEPSSFSVPPIRELLDLEAELTYPGFPIYESGLSSHILKIFLLRIFLTPWFKVVRSTLSLLPGPSTQETHCSV